MAKKKKDLTVHELAELKNDAFKLGRRAVRGFELANLKKFYVDNHLDDVKHDGHVMEVLVAFMLGMIQKVPKHDLKVEMTEEDDKHQIDFRINNFPIQQKFDWKDKRKVHSLQVELWKEGHILVINIEHHENGSRYTIIDSLMDMLRFAELSENKIKGLDKNPALVASEKIWMWYCDHVKLRDVKLLF